MNKYSNLKPLKFSIITDTHYYSKKNGVYGAAYEKEKGHAQTLLRESEEIIKETFDLLCEDQERDIVIISGDITCSGDYDSHAEVIELLRDMQKKGKRIIATISGHDYKNVEKIEKKNALKILKGDKLEELTADGYKDDKIIKLPAYTTEEIDGMYDEFGPNEAIAKYKDWSYTVQLAEGYRMLALNDDFGDREAGFKKEHMDWIREQVKDAKENNQYIFAITHHPILPPSPLYNIIGSTQDMMDDYMYVAEEFADMGINLVFTGHTHIQDASYHITDKGNVFYDFSTSALVGYPPNMRKVEINAKEGTAKVETVTIENCRYLDTKGESLPIFMKNKFLGMIELIFNAAATGDMHTFYERMNDMSIRKSMLKNVRFLIKPVAKYLNKLTIGKVGKWTKKETGLKKEDYRDIKDEKVVPIIMEVVTKFYAGDACIPPTSSKYKIAMALMSIIDSLLKTVKVDLYKITGYSTVSEIIDPLIYNAGIGDNNAEIFIFSEKAIEVLPPITKYTPPYTSKKGPKIIAFLVCLAILASPILIPCALVFFICKGIKKFFKLFTKKKTVKNKN